MRGYVQNVLQSAISVMTKATTEIEYSLNKERNYRQWLEN